MFVATGINAMMKPMAVMHAAVTRMSGHEMIIG